MVGGRGVHEAKMGIGMGIWSGRGGRMKYTRDTILHDWKLRGAGIWLEYTTVVRSLGKTGRRTLAHTRKEWLFDCTASTIRPIGSAIKLDRISIVLGVHSNLCSGCED